MRRKRERERSHAPRHAPCLAEGREGGRVGGGETLADSWTSTLGEAAICRLFIYFFFMSRILQSCANSGRILNVQGFIKTNPRTVAIPGCLGGSSWVMPPDCIRRLEDGARFQSSSNVNRTLILINCTLRPYAHAITVILFHSLVVSW